jgi:hypothetical protein
MENLQTQQHEKQTQKTLQSTRDIRILCLPCMDGFPWTHRNHELMTRTTFYSICYNHSIHPSIALENPKVRELLKFLKNCDGVSNEQKEERLQEIFEEQF